MKYSDLFEFDPITSVVQLTQVQGDKLATDLVRTYVVSKEMEAQFVQTIIPHLQFEHYEDNKALMIVGNYGTGKSHMMSVISSIAENAKYIQYLQNEPLKIAAEQIGGKFKVLRLEIGGVDTPLATIILRNEIEPFLRDMGIDYEFPPSNTISNFKNGLEEMMARFAVKFPNTGLMLVIDEMLGFLQGKNEQDLIKDLEFLRQLAEFCEYSKLRVVFGVQESIFDSPKFKFVSDTIGKIKDRTEIIAIQKSDMKFVIEQRLLKKNSSQKDYIRRYLEKFKPYYNSLSDKFESFVSLFPVHPSFLDSFSNMIAIEKREILKTVSSELMNLKDQEIDESNLKLITIDTYWPKLNAATHVIEGMKEVKDVYSVLSGKIDSIRQAPYKEMARRIVNALCIQRMTDTDISRPIGLTATDLRDTLCLFEKSIEELGSTELDADLLTHIESVIKELMKVVNGQFITINQEGQYYIDIHKTVDFDQVIDNKAQSLSADRLDQYYYEVLKQMLECSDGTSFMSNSKIWDYELKWFEKKMFRKGWLFFGLPNERPTAIPEKDFYLYFIPPMSAPRYTDDRKSDELIFKLENKDEDFLKNLKLYAAASELALTSSSNQKSTYLNKAENHFAALSSWFFNNLSERFTITYRGSTKQIRNWIVGTDLRALTGISPNTKLYFKDTFDAVASFCLREEFEQQAPEYPAFTVDLSAQNFSSAINETSRYILTRQGSGNLPIAILKGLNLLSDGYATPKNSDYAQWILSKLKEKPDGVVLKKEELITRIHGEEYLANPAYRLEKGFVSLLLLTLVVSGDIVITLRGRKYDASNLKELMGESAENIADFSHIDRPKDWNPAFLQAFVRLFELADGHVRLIQQGDEQTIAEIQKKNIEIIDKLAKASYVHSEGLMFWGENIALTQFPNLDLKQSIEDLKQDFEALKVLNTIGKLKSPNVSVEKLEDIHQRHKNISSLISYAAELDALSERRMWFDTAKKTIGHSSDWGIEYQELIDEVRVIVREFNLKEIGGIKGRFDALEKNYIRQYEAKHAKSRLTKTHQKHKESVINGTIMKSLNVMQRIPIISKSSLEKERDALFSLKECTQLREDDLHINPICPHCFYDPSRDGVEDSSYILSQIEERLGNLLDSWVASVVDNLEDPMNQEAISLMGQYEQDQIADLLRTRKLPDTLTESYVDILVEALSGLVKKDVSREELGNRLFLDGSPATLIELRDNFNKFIEDLARGEDPDKIRVILE